MQIHYTFIRNMPGYLPEADPECYDTWDDAKQAAIDYMERTADHLDSTGEDEDHDTAEEYSAAAELLNLEIEVRGIHPTTLGGRKAWDTQIGNLCLSITPDWHDEEECGDGF